MSAKSISKRLQRGLTHLEAPPTKGGKFGAPIPSHFMSKPKFVQVKDRIPWWNIAPNDKVILVKGGQDVKGKEGVVESVDRKGNKVTMNESNFATKRRIPAEYPGEALSPEYRGSSNPIYITKAFHVSNVRLRMTVGGKVYTAARIKRSPVTWDRSRNRFSWKRYGLITDLTAGPEKGWFPIKWPKEITVMSEKGPLDAPSGLTPASSSWFPSLTTSNPTPSGSSPQPRLDSPKELKVSYLDLGGGYHSRASRNARFHKKREEEIQFGKNSRIEEVKEKRKLEKGLKELEISA